VVRLGTGVQLDWVIPVLYVGTRSTAAGAAGLRAGAGGEFDNHEQYRCHPERSEGAIRPLTAEKSAAL
jgi:hypothetical protein